MIIWGYFKGWVRIINIEYEDMDIFVMYEEMVRLNFWIYENICYVYGEKNN